MCLIWQVAAERDSSPLSVDGIFGGADRVALDGEFLEQLGALRGAIPSLVREGQRKMGHGFAMSAGIRRVAGRHWRVPNNRINCPRLGRVVHEAARVAVAKRFEYGEHLPVE